MATTISPSMSLPIPVVGIEAGPQYATDINNCLTIVDAHNHSPGYGVQITPAGLNINADLPLGGNNLTATRSLRLNSQTGALVGVSDIGCVYNNQGNLYYNNNSGVAVQITNGNSIAGATGSITGLVSPASASYVAGQQKFVWQSNTNTPADMDNGPVTIREIAVSPNGVTIASPSALAANYTLTLPTALGGSNLPVSVDASGNMSIGQITLPQLITAIQQALNPAGSILAFGGPVGNIPTGYLYCDGSAVSRTTYSALFAAIGTAWGSGDGSTTFNLPTTNGRFLRGQANGVINATTDPDSASRLASAAGGNTGDNVGSYQNSQNIAHAHTFAQWVSGIQNNTGQFLDLFGAGSVGGTGHLWNAVALSSVNNVAGHTYIDNLNDGGLQSNPNNLYVNYMIKT